VISSYLCIAVVPINAFSFFVVLVVWRFFQFRTLGEIFCMVNQ
jgi:hypothetical protein